MLLHKKELIKSMEKAKLQANVYHHDDPTSLNTQPVSPQSSSSSTKNYEKPIILNGIPMEIQPMQFFIVQVDHLSQEEVNIYSEMNGSRTIFFVFLVILAFFNVMGIIG